jgi:hypothetical protein
MFGYDIQVIHNCQLQAFCQSRKHTPLKISSFSRFQQIAVNAAEDPKKSSQFKELLAAGSL